MPRQRVLSGMRPTGKLHLGNLVGALDNWCRLQEEYDCFFFAADWHALTTEYGNTEIIRESIRDMVLDWLSVGLTPEKSVLFIQSRVKEHAELHLLLSMITPLPWLERVPTYKEQQQELASRDLSTYGFLGYPLLQAADIVIYKAHRVPVGIDQVPHVELTREVARRFNAFYGPVFPVPDPLLTEVPKLLGIDGRKMSKSYDNAIYISDPPDVIEAKVRTMYTDPTKLRRTDPGHPEGCHVYAMLKAYGVEEMHDDCTHGRIGCVECKTRLARFLSDRLAPIQERRRELEAHPERVVEVLAVGAEKARKVAQTTMADVRRAMNLD